MPSGFLELGVLLHQLLQPEPRELYRNLGVFPIPFSLEDRAFAVFRVPHLLAGTESFLSLRLLHHRLGQIELLASGGEELCNIVDGVVALARVGGLGAFRPLTLPAGALILIFVRVVSGSPVVIVSPPRLTRPCSAACPSRRPARTSRSAPARARRR